MTSMPPPWDPDDAETEETRILPRDETAETRALPRTPPPRRERVVLDEEGPPPPPPPARAPRELWPWLLLLLGLVAALLAAAWWFSQDDDDGEAATTKPVPSVVRLRVGDARDVLTSQGFAVEARHRATDRAAKGIVFRQAPRAGARLDEGGTVQIWVSAGPASTTVPDVVGLSVDEARQALEDAGLTARVATVRSAREQGTVVAQAPKAGSEVQRDSAVRLNVSGGPGTVAVPDVVGTNVQEAQETLRAARLAVATEEVDSDEPAGTVVEQDPAAGTDAARGSSVRLSVSRGPVDQPVPDVVGLAEDEARSQLEDTGFRVRVVQEPASDPSQVGFVVRQVPAAGREAPPQTLVTIVVGT